MDEAKPDFDEQFRSRDVGHHRYFVNPYKMPTDNWGPAVSKQSCSVSYIHDLYEYDIALSDWKNRCPNIPFSLLSYPLDFH
jgi:hypothetical protein